MQGIKALADQRVLGDLGTLVPSIYSVNKSHWLINKPNVGECGRCLWNESAVFCSSSEPAWQPGPVSLSPKGCSGCTQWAGGIVADVASCFPTFFPRSLWFLLGMYFPVRWRWSSLCRKWAHSGSICCCQETSSSPDFITGHMGWCRIFLGRFSISQGAASTGMGNVEVQTSMT